MPTPSHRAGPAIDEVQSGRRGHHGRALRGAGLGTEHHYVTAAFMPAAKLDTHRSHSSLRMRTAHHRQWRRQPVAPGSSHPGRHPIDAGERRHQQERIRERTPVAVSTGDRIGKPAQLPTRPAGPAGPTAVTPVDGKTAERPVMLAGARRTARTDLGNVDLVDSVELRGTHTGQ